VGAEALSVLRSCARPVIFATGLKETPFSTAGTCILLGYHASAYVVTAQHVLRGWPIERLHICASDHSIRPLPLVQGYELPERKEDSDLADLAIIKIELAAAQARARRSGNLIRVPDRPEDWFPHRASATFFFYGFPLGPIVVDLPSISTTQYLLTGAYRGPSVDFGCFEISVENRLSLQDFNGMSGSPVFCLVGGLQASQPILAGMVLRGTASSGRAHFLGFERIFEALRSLERGYVT
jgi:hypothetical protein